LKKAFNIYLLLSGILGIAGIFFCIRWSSHGIARLPYLAFVPSFMFLMIYILDKYVKNRIMHFIFIPVFVICISFCGFVFVVTEFFLHITSPMTNPAEYVKIISESERLNKSLINHFPRKIPVNAKHIKFYYYPGFFQEGAHLQLRYETDPEEINKLYKRFSKLKTKSFIGGDTNLHLEEEYGMPTTIFYTSNSKDKKFPEDYEIMVFDEIPESNDEGVHPYWNHGKTHGVAISKKRNEIIYWAESW
jgi:hypothetical protein